MSEVGQVVDIFAGGGGASTGLERALGRVDVAINHDPRAIAMHEANHPYCRHYHCDVWEVDPVEATGGRPVSVLWASPDCTFFSKARGSAPYRDRRFANRRRALATVVVSWAKATRPRVILMENVEEFVNWGPVGDDGRPVASKRGVSFRRWVRSLENLGYRVEWQNLTACDFGAPTSRKRLFIVARCDGLPIVWPRPTHGPSTYRTAADIIDWSIEGASIFERKRPLADATCRRIARGIVEKVIADPAPFIVPRVHTLIQRGQGERPGQAPRVPGLDKPLGTLVAQGRKHALISGVLAPFISYGQQGGRSRPIDEPMHTITASAKDTNQVVTAFMARYWGGMTGNRLDDRPWPTLTTKGCQDQIVELDLLAPVQPFGHSGEVRAFLAKYYGTGACVRPDAPMDTLTTKARFGLVTVAGCDYQITDIRMRMLTPREMFAAQGFPADYIIDTPKRPTASLSAAEDVPRIGVTDQTFLVGNSVCPPVSEALARANCIDVYDGRRAA